MIHPAIQTKEDIKKLFEKGSPFKEDINNNVGIIDSIKQIHDLSISKVENFLKDVPIQTLETKKQTVDVSLEFINKDSNPPQLELPSIKPNILKLETEELIKTKEEFKVKQRE
jgi:hypothetical protein